MKVKIIAYIHASQVQRYCAESQSYREELQWEAYPFDMSSTGNANRVFVGNQELEIEIPEEFDIRAGLVRNLESEKKRLMAEFNARVTAIDSQIQKYLAIENATSTEVA